MTCDRGPLSLNEGRHNKSKLLLSLFLNEYEFVLASLVEDFSAWPPFLDLSPDRKGPGESSIRDHEHAEMLAKRQCRASVQPLKFE